MRAYTIDQLTEQDVAAIAGRLTDMELQGGVEGIFWLPVPGNFLTPLQQEHEETCGPYCLALDLEGSALQLELLVRGKGRISCGCISFASVELRNHMIGFVEDMLRELEVVF